MSMSDERFMRRALQLARRGAGWVSPNPMVGAVIVKDGTIIGEGYHRKFGAPHAEINAIAHASAPLAGATMYVTLEPCSHYGKTPPCVDKIIETRAARVVVGVQDPNPLVAGRGIQLLEEHGIETTVGVLEEECRQLNEIFFKYMTAGIPFVTVKYAQTLDGRIATATGHSKWISSEPSLRFAHRLRSLHDGILVGAGTVLRDDPELTVRHVRGRNPVRIVVDSTLRIPDNARILDTQRNATTIVATTVRSSVERRDILEQRGIEVLITDETKQGRVDLESLLPQLAAKNISSILVEGGADVITSFVHRKLPDRMVIITAPKIAGKGIEGIGDLGINKIDNSIQLVFKKISRRGDDVIFDARIRK